METEKLLEALRKLRIEEILQLEFSLEDFKTGQVRVKQDSRRSS